MAGLGSGEIVKQLDEPLDDRRPVVNHIEHAAAAQDLISALTAATNPVTRQILADILGRRHEETAVPALIKALDDPAIGVRASAADALGKIGSPEAGEAVWRRLQREPEESVRQMLILALGATGYRAAIPFLLSALKDPSPVIRGCAARALLDLRAKEALHRLEEALRSETDSFPRNQMTAAVSGLRGA